MSDEDATSVIRTRSEYRLAPIGPHPTSMTLVTRRVLDSDRNALAKLMLDAYAGTVDDEGETTDDALEAVDHYLGCMVEEHSLVVTEHALVVAMAFVVAVDDLYYVDPIAVAASRKRSGVGGDAVRLILDSLARAGETEVGATITDGNVASEQLFLGLGFTRRGSWS